MKNDHRSQFSNLSLKKSGLQSDSNPWPPRYRCDALPTELWSHTLGARSIYWVHISREEWNDVKYVWSNPYIWTADLDESVWLHSSVGRASHRYRGGHGFESRWSPDFFRLILSHCLNWRINCDDHFFIFSRAVFWRWVSANWTPGRGYSLR